MIQYCYVLGCKNNSKAIFSLQNLTQHENFEKTTLVRILLRMKSVIPSPFLFRFKGNDVSNQISDLLVHEQKKNFFFSNLVDLYIVRQHFYNGTFSTKELNIETL